MVQGQWVCFRFILECKHVKVITKSSYRIPCWPCFIRSAYMDHATYVPWHLNQLITMLCIEMNRNEIDYTFNSLSSSSFFSRWYYKLYLQIVYIFVIHISILVIISLFTSPQISMLFVVSVLHSTRHCFSRSYFTIMLYTHKNSCINSSIIW